MALDSGTRLGPYEILAQLGAGGMGEVYKATDRRLNRTVAIKVLPPHLSQDPERKHRFEREAQTIAALNHPNICTLHDVGREGDTDFLVMEYLEGETLGARLAKGPMPLDEALKVAIGVADALEKAHGQGVTHRDLKPGNIMLTPSGAKLLDFGLAKLTEQAKASASGSVLSNVAANTTAPGMILGTMQYMAPEQLEGKEADARTDIFAFGSVLYEMVTGRKAFEGKNQPHLIAAIISSQPDPMAKTLPTVPPTLDFLVQRCLAKDPDERLQTATDLVWKLRWIAEGGAEGGAIAPLAAGWRRTRIAQLALAAVTLLVLGMAVMAVRSSEGTEARVENRFLIDVPDMPVPEAVSISPDGRVIAYSAGDGASTAVFVRPVNTEVGQKLAGTEGAGRLFWSPDSRWIGFLAGGRLKKVEAAGGPPQNICETPDLLGGTWNSMDVIVFASSKGLQRVAAAGGQPSAIALSEEVQRAREPHFLPDGRQYLFLASSGADSDAIFAGELDSTSATRLVDASSNAVYAEPGYLLYHREGTLYAQPFDAGDAEITGDAIRLADGLPYSEAGAAAFAASQTGVLIFRNDPQRQAAPGGAPAPAGASSDRPLRWVLRTGNSEPAAAQGGWAGVDVSPDGKRAAVHRHEAGGGDLWIFEAGNSTPSRFTFDAAQDNSSPVWSPDASRIAFSSRRNGRYGIYVKLADNTRAEELLLDSEATLMPMSWSGNQIVYWTRDPKTAGDIWSVSADPAGDKKPIPILQTQADERNPQVSPDGKWIAYSSNETGRSEVYVRPFPEGTGRIQVSVNGGVYPRWRRDGRELYFMNLVVLGSLMASDIRTSGASIQREVPRTVFQSLFPGEIHDRGESHAYGVSADGQRFLIPQFESVNAGFGRGGPGGFATAVGFAVPTVTADRRGSVASVSRSTAPITVVINWRR